MLKRKKSIFHIVLSGMLLLLCVELVPFFGYMFSINLPERLNRNSSNILQKQTDNRQTYLEDKLLKNHNLTELADTIDDTLLKMLDEGTITLDGLNEDSASYVPLLQKISGELIETFRAKDVTGIFVALNTRDMDTLSDDDKFPGIYIRDLDPDAIPSERNSDLFLERSPMQLVQSLFISTDKNWQPFICMGTREADDFIYPAFQTAYLDQASLEESDYGHLTTTMYTLKGDSRYALAYSIPLILPNGTVYGVLGVEMLDTYLQSLLPAEELENQQEGLYLLAHTDAKELNSEISVQVAAVSDEKRNLMSEQLTLHIEEKADVKDCWLQIEDTKYSAAVIPLTLYNRNTPFSGEQWLLIGTVPTEELFSFSEEVNTSLKWLCVFSFVLGLICCILFSKKLSQPIYQLYCDLLKAQEQPNKLPTFHPTNITELDQFSTAITSLSQEIIDTSAKFVHIIEMASVRMAGYEIRYDTNKVYVTENFFEMLGLPESSVAGFTREEFDMILKELDKLYVHSDAASGGKVYRIELENGDIRYLHMKKAYFEVSEVGVLEDETADTLEQIRIRHERDHDPLTNIYNRRAVQKRYRALFQKPQVLKYAAAVMLDLDNLKYINDTYGHAYGDVYIQAAGQCLSEYLPPKTLYGRISGDEFFAFLYGYQSKEELQCTLDQFAESIQKKHIYLPDGAPKRISMSGGIAWYGKDASEPETLKKCADFAMYQMKKNHKGNIGEWKSDRTQQE